MENPPQVHSARSPAPAQADCSLIFQHNFCSEQSFTISCPRASLESTHIPLFDFNVSLLLTAVHQHRTATEFASFPISLCCAYLRCEYSSLPPLLLDSFADEDGAPSYKEDGLG